MQNLRPGPNDGGRISNPLSLAINPMSIHAEVWGERAVESPDPTAYRLPMARLSVNLNKIALLRNSRHTGVPDLRRFARLALDAGAQGLTVHPRPDERHIRGSDIAVLASVMTADRPT